MELEPLSSPLTVSITLPCYYPTVSIVSHIISETQLFWTYGADRAVREDRLELRPSLGIAALLSGQQAQVLYSYELATMCIPIPCPQSSMLPLGRTAFQLHFSCPSPSTHRPWTRFYVCSAEWKCDILSSFVIGGGRRERHE